MALVYVRGIDPRTNRVMVGLTQVSSSGKVTDHGDFEFVLEERDFEDYQAFKTAVTRKLIDSRAMRLAKEARVQSWRHTDWNVPDDIMLEEPV